MRILLLIIGLIVCDNFSAQSIFEKKGYKVCVKNVQGKKCSNYYSEIRLIDSANFICYFYSKETSGLINGEGDVLIEGVFGGFEKVKTGVYAGYSDGGQDFEWIIVDKEGKHLANYEEDLAGVDWSSEHVSLRKQKDTLIAVYNANNEPITKFEFTEVDFFKGDDGIIGIIKKIGEEKFRYFYNDGRVSEEFYD